MGPQFEYIPICQQAHFDYKLIYKSYPTQLISLSNQYSSDFVSVCSKISVSNQCPLSSWYLDYHALSTLFFRI